MSGRKEAKKTNELTSGNSEATSTIDDELDTTIEEMDGFAEEKQGKKPESAVAKNKLENEGTQMRLEELKRGYVQQRTTNKHPIAENDIADHMQNLGSGSLSACKRLFEQ